MSRDFTKRFSVAPSRKSSTSSNGNGHKCHSDRPSELAHREERKANLKHAVFYVAVALVLILAGRLGRVSKAQHSTASQPSGQGVTLVLRLQARLETQFGLTVRFRLGNAESHSVFYPVYPGTNVPVGEIVTRASSSSDWMPLSAKSQLQWSPESIDRTLRWIEMPPGGWVDGEFSDPGMRGGEHAYAILLKPGRDADPLRILSEPYNSGRN